MTNQTATRTPADRGTGGSPIHHFMRATELDTRLLGMIGALLIVWVGFHIMSGGLFITPRNLWNLSVQTASVAIMATGMVLIIVTRNIDLSVGSILGIVAMLMGVMQAEVLPSMLGYGHPAIWIITLVFGIVIGVAVGGLQGLIVAFLRVPSFIVTLGGYLVWRGAAWWVTSGRTVAPLDSTFQLMGGGPSGAIGALPSWIVAGLACAGIVAYLLYARRQRRRFNFTPRPLWAEVTLGVLGCGATLATVAVFNSYPLPARIAQQAGSADGAFIAHGIAIPVLIAVVVGVGMTFIATRTRFGRYVFAIGGNPEAADLAGINTRLVTVKVFMLMGALCAIAGAIASARLNAATNALGTFDELYVIAAAVIGGASLSGGVGTIVGAMIGALVMQSLQSGMVLMGLDSPLQNIVVGAVLVFAVWLDTLYRNRAG